MLIKGNAAMKFKLIVAIWTVIMPSIALAQNAPAPNFAVGVSPDHHQVTIKFASPINQMNLTASEADSFITVLGAERAKLDPPVADNPFSPKGVHVANPSRYAMQKNPMGGFDLIIRDPGFGWIAIRLTAQEAGQFAQRVQVLHPGGK
jgi:hypothetical protein